MKTKKRTSIEILKRFFQPAFHEKRISLKVMFPSILGSLIGVTAVYLLKDITNGISNGLNNETIFLLFIFIGLVLIDYLILITTRNWTYAVLWPSYRKYMYSKYIKEFTYLDNNETEKLGTGKLIAMIDKGMHSWVDLVVRFFLEILPNATFAIFGFMFIGFINIYYLFAIMIVFIFVFILTYVLQKKAKIYRIKRRDSNIGITRRFVKILMAKFEILQNEKGIEEFNDISKALDYNVSLNYKMRSLGIFTEIGLKILIDGSKIMLILMFGMGLGNNLINFGEFVALMSILYILDQILTKSIHLYVEFTKIFVDVEKIWDFFDTTPRIKGYITGKKFKYIKGKIKIENLSFGYTKNKLIFKNFDLKLSGEKVTAFVGNSGSGKSTLIKLIAGYIRSTSGNILIDDQKINKISLKSYYKNIGYLTQEPSVFDGTILNNLSYSVKKKLKKGEIDKILKLAKCEFVYDLPKGINTQIGERGVRLSGGQKQRLAIAKIFLKNPNIVILDEPTSALDSFSEEQITIAMHNLFKGRTVIIIAHRLQTVKHADDIILIENGKIKERGT
ncbi:MAG: ABC transporter ATP-binding protein, partial [Candidatus Gracilibacteria bacterium]